MQVVLGVLGGLEVDHGADVVDVDAAGRHVGGDQHVQLALGEALERPLARLLRQVAVDRRDVDAEIVQVLLDAVAQALGLAEHEDLGDALPDRADDPRLVHVVHGQEQVVHRADRVGGESIATSIGSDR